jgi:hypothetical protein
MLQNSESVDFDAIAESLLRLIWHLEYSQECTELLRLMIDMLECPELGSPKRLKILAEQIESMWEDAQESTTVELRRLRELCDPPTPKPVIKSSSPEQEL